MLEILAEEMQEREQHGNGLDRGGITSSGINGSGARRLTLTGCDAGFAAFLADDLDRPCASGNTRVARESL